MITATTPIECIGGDNPPALPNLPPIAPRTRVPVRIIGGATWTPQALEALATLVHQDQHTTTDAGCAPAV